MTLCPFGAWKSPGVHYLRVETTRVAETLVFIAATISPPLHSVCTHARDHIFVHAEEESANS